MEILIVFVFGIVFGSFLNVVILRIPKGESVVYESSHCYACNTPLKPWHNIPLFSWIFLRGKCSFCKTKISIQYPIIEFISGVIFVLLTLKSGLTLPIFFIALSFLMLLALSMIDFKYKMVPDSLNLLAMFFAIIGASNIHGIFDNFLNALIFAGGFTLLRFALSYYLTSSLYRAGLKTKTAWNKHYDRTPFVEAMGEGDIMVAATMGALLGSSLTLSAIFLSALLALPIMLALQNTSKEAKRVPFVPFLALATFIVYMLDTPILAYIEATY